MGPEPEPRVLVQPSANMLGSLALVIRMLTAAVLIVRLCARFCTKEAL